MPLLYLASQSPRRRQLLDQIGVPHQLLLPGDDEDAEALEAVLAGESPDDYVQRVTTAKLDAALQRRVRRQLPPAPVLCADTTVTIDGHILGKPEDGRHALAMLRQLSGREHRVLTAVALGLPGDSTAGTAGGPAQGLLGSQARRLTALSISTVRFDAVPEERLQAYVDTGEPLGKAGGYAIQSQAAAWVSHIGGSYSGIMGLPLYETAQLLRAAGWAL